MAGEIFLDLLMSGIDSWPEPGKEIFAHQFSRELGGGAPITACALARLDCAASMLAAVGLDAAGWIAERLGACGVNTENLKIDAAESTGITVVASRPEDRAFITYRGANHLFPKLLEERLKGPGELPRHIHIAAPLALDWAEELIATIHARGSTVSLDVGWHPNWLEDPRAIAVARSADIFFPNEMEARAMTGEQTPAEILHAFAARGLRRVALKLGSQGAALLSDGQTHFVSRYPVHCVDTTGAGDCFDAGFLQAWLTGVEPCECLARANICGALSTEMHGGIAGAPDLDKLNQHLRTMAR